MNNVRIPLCLIITMTFYSQINSQHYRFFSRPEGELFDKVTTSCIQNDTVYAVVQSGDIGVASHTSLYKVPVSDGIPVLIQDIPTLAGYLRPRQMIIADNIIHLAYMPFDVLPYRCRIDKYKLEDLSLISSDDYIVKNEASGFPRIQIVSFHENIIIGGSQNELLNEDGDLGFIIWVDKDNMQVEKMVLYDDPNYFYNGVDPIGIFEDTLVVVHSVGDENDFSVKLYDKDRILISDELLVTDPIPFNGLKAHTIFDETLVTNRGEIIATVGTSGYRRFDLRGNELRSFQDAPEFPHRGKIYSLPTEMSDGSIIFHGDGLISLDEMDPIIEDIDFEIDGPRKTAYAMRHSFGEQLWELDEIFDYSYFEFDEHENNKLFSINRIHETENGDLFGFGMGSEVLDSFAVLFRQATGDIWTFRMGSDGCIQEENCGANQVYNFITSTKNIDEEESIERYQIYPKPTLDQFTIEFNENLSFRYALYNLQGQLLKEGASRRNLRISMENYPSGNYLLRAYDDQSGQLIFTELVSKL